MTLSKELVSIMILFFPGIIVTTMLQYFNIKSKRYSEFEFILYCFINGIAVIFILYLLNFEREHIFNILKCEEFSKIKDTLLTEFSNKKFFYIFTVTILFALTLINIRTNSAIRKLAADLSLTFETGYETLLDATYHSKEDIFQELQNKGVEIKIGNNSYLGTLEYCEVHETTVEIIIKEIDSRTFKEKDSYVYLSPERQNLQIRYVEILNQTTNCSNKISFLEKLRSHFTCFLIISWILIYIIGQHLI